MSPPADWSRNIVRGKTYSTDTEFGRRLYGDVMERIKSPATAEPALHEARYGRPILVQPRLGQGGFRYAVTERYRRRCAMTGERSLPALEAAHIRPYKADGPHKVSNGLLLRADIHRLFDTGYITVRPDLHIAVSKRLREEFSNGRDYYVMDTKPLLVLPELLQDKPGREFLDWHYENKFLK
jgi:putative restriction endonuclease